MDCLRGRLGQVAGDFKVETGHRRHLAGAGQQLHLANAQLFEDLGANAVLTTENDEQAEVRMAEKGADAARVAVEMANLLIALEELQAEED